jgi:hypothetical protein
MTSYRGNPSVGSKVTSSDGEELGTVRQIAGTCFKVAAPHHDEYWLGVDTVAKTSGGGVQLNLTRDALGNPSYEGLPHHGYHRHN